MATKEQRQNKRFVQKLLQIQGIDYDDWLDGIHNEYIQENNQLIFEALDSKLNINKEPDINKEDEQENEKLEDNERWSV